MKAALRLGLCVFAACWFLAGCFETQVAEPDKGGNSSETVARVGGKVVDGQGQSAAGAAVALVPDNFNPMTESLPAGLTAVTDGRGEFAMTQVPKGHYAVEARRSDGTRLFRGGLDLEAAQESIPQDTLRQCGRIRIRIPDYIKQPGGYIYIPHTRYYVQVDGTALEHGYVDLDSLPPYTYAAADFAKDTSLSQPDTLGRDLGVRSGDSVTVGALQGWKHAARLALNTTASGAAIASDLTGFPLLVRLDAGNFDFSQAASDGSDLRFDKPDGFALAYQIDHWDAAAKQAAVWVEMDTVHANDSTRWINMHWGKAIAPSRSNGAAVFGAAGYGGVWHIEEEAAGVGNPGVYLNSARDADHGLDSLSATDRTGVIGYGHRFQNGEYIRVPSASAALKPAKTVTLSAWVKPQLPDSSGGEIASMGNDYGIRVTPDGNAYAFSFNVPKTDSTGFLLATSGVNMLDGAWHFVVGIINGNHIDIYVDGVFKVGKDFPGGVFKYDGGPDFFIGQHGNGETRYAYTGWIDEVRVMGSISGADWIKLSYATQKPDASALRLLP